MYLFSIKNNRSNPDIIIIRILFAVVATAAFVQTYNYGILAILVGIIFLAISFFIKLIRRSYNVPAYVFLLIGTASLCVITRTWYFVLIPILHFSLEKWLGKETLIRVGNTNIVIKKTISEKILLWQDIEHVILKDGLLTIGLRNNHFIQSEINIGSDIDEQKFNGYCAMHLLNKS